ncbi:MAG: dihydroorotate dehydrogenase electron transfer subunit [Actinobacteria bacterium]|nr:dihydroorotate dehydrogenase electron transfer subunit [Actinomycetota bacterium]MBU1942213.1 dihydroorotate dehydrogenase electron transfer subunit [Actinomycetota bacterium]MBU2687438.1 dihydroorotate dehydrogenase electron transfer subunit [Actinomycetota bacterium]
MQRLRVAEHGPALVRAVVARNERVAARVCVLDLRLEEDVPAPSAGQFFLVDCGGGREHLLRRPLSVMGYDPAPQPALIFLVEVVGWGTRRLCAMQPGEKVGLLGPLGRGFGAPAGRFSLLIAGGMGIAPLLFLSHELKSREQACDLIAGFRDSGQVFGGRQDIGSPNGVCTEDGSMGGRGKVCDGLAGRLSEFGYTSVFACGPGGMLEETARVCAAAGVPCQVSLDSRMACGLGMCRGCVKQGAGGANLCVCKDGPVFDSTQVFD